MREGFDKEIDSLLRRRARGMAESFADGMGPAAHTHLDADELSAFAEGALPSAARVAAASHMADCDECRGLAVGLARVHGGVELKEPPAAVPAAGASGVRAGWRVWAATLFSPRVLRFAAPALALSLVAVVSYVALRTRRPDAPHLTSNERRRAEVSKNQADAVTSTTTEMSNVNAGAVAEQTPDGAQANTDAAPAPAQPHVGRGHGVADVPPATADTVAPEAAPAPPPPAAATGVEAPAHLAKAAPRPAEDEGTEAERADERSKEKSARPAEPAEEVAANDLAAQQQRRGAQARANEAQMPDGSRNQRRSADNNASNVYGGGGSGSNAGPPPREPEVEGLGVSPRAPRRNRPPTRGEQKAGDDEVVRVGETRVAAGHRFRREGSAWVDVNYKPSMPSTGVRRGTEAFRALVADIPAIGRVAEQIGGEVVVVIGGRAYRIR